MSCGSEAKQKQQAASTGDHWKAKRDSPHRESSNENESHHPSQVEKKQDILGIRIQPQGSTTR